MHRLSMFLGILLLLLSGGGYAQGAGKAYAPEDLQRLSVNDRIRVLNKEYSDLSAGQTLPKDQLEFYLDQIEESRWGFSEIRHDMQESLGARPDSSIRRPVAVPPPVAVAVVQQPARRPIDLVECASRNQRYTECATPFYRPQLERNLTRSACVEGRSWGTHGSIVWVSNNCRGLFVEGQVRPPVHDSATCASEGSERVQCPMPFRGPARLRQQLSSSPCVEGRTWGSVSGSVWVARGCRGIFEPAGPGASYYPSPSAETICESRNGGLRICDWNDRDGRPRLLREISRGQCVEGRSWGVDARGLWVDRGCSAVFGIR